MLNTDHILADIAAAADCSPDQVRLVVGRAMAALHKIAVCDERSVTSAIMECYWQLGEEACYHLGGILEEARMRTGPKDEPWSETYLRFAPELLPKYRPVLETWLNERTETRKLIDSMNNDE